MVVESYKYKHIQKVCKLVRSFTLAEDCVISPGISVLVRPEHRSDAGRDDGFDSWVMEVTELRQNEFGDKYIIGVWWLDREHALQYMEKASDRHIVMALGEGELILSNWLDCISVDTVEGVVEVSVFRDAKHKHEPVNWRWTRFTAKDNRLVFDRRSAPCPQCHQYYDPNLHVQILCDRCKHWYDMDCCKEVGGMYGDKGGVPIAHSITVAPSIRGALRSGEGDWVVTGSGPHSDPDEHQNILSCLERLVVVECPQCKITIGGDFLAL